MHCIFCAIIEKKIPSEWIYEDEQVIAIKDIAPQAPTHILVFPKKHIENLMQISKKDDTLMQHVLKSIQTIVKLLKLEDNGFRIVANTGKDGGQTVDHLHFHILGGRSLSWPPG